MGWPLTIVGGVRERLVVTRRGRRKRLCARGAWWALLGGPSTSPLAVAMTGRWLGLGVAFVLALVGYNWWLDLTRGARALGQASAMVTLSARRVDCIVQRTGAKSGDRVPCGEVGAYLRDTLNLSRGTSVGLTALGKVNPDALASVSKDLSAHGFKIAGVLRVGIIGEPGGAR